jgi:hypothetical protein
MQRGAYDRTAVRVLVDVARQVRLRVLQLFLRVLLVELAVVGAVADHVGAAGAGSGRHAEQQHGEQNERCPEMHAHGPSTSRTALPGQGKETAPVRSGG